MRLASVRTIVTLIFAIFSADPAHAQDADTVVDLELVLAVDVSASIDGQQARLQREGYIAALTDQELVDRIAAGALGRIAVTYVEWSRNQTTVVDWTVIANIGDARAFAEAIRVAPIVSGSATSISGAVDYGVAKIVNNRIEGTRRVIDLSGDGRNAAGHPLIFSRQRALDEGIVINGLPIIQRGADGSPVDPGLEDYFSANVIGGPGAFLVVAEDRNAFPYAIRSKLLIEIAGSCAGICNSSVAANGMPARP